jgi:hypothetical protein
MLSKYIVSIAHFGIVEYSKSGWILKYRGVNMSKEIYMRIRDGEKESEIKLPNLDPQHQLALIDGVFKFFDLDVDFMEMAEIYNRSGKAYKEFFNEIDSKSNYTEEIVKVPRKAKTKIDQKITSDQYEATYNEIRVSEIPENNLPLNNGYHPRYEFNNDNYYVTGIKYNSLNNPIYKCRYKCPQCKKESNRYIKKGTKHIRCWQCQRILKVQPATIYGEPSKEKDPESYRDEKGNFYIAGSFNNK